MKCSRLMVYLCLGIGAVLTAACTNDVMVASGELDPSVPRDSNVKKIWESTDDSGTLWFSSIDVFDDNAFIVACSQLRAPGGENIESSRLAWYTPSGDIDSVVYLEDAAVGVHALPNHDVIAAVVSNDYVGDYEFIKTTPQADILWSITFPARLSFSGPFGSGEMNAAYVFDVTEEGSLVVYGLFADRLTLGAGEENETLLDSSAVGGRASFLAVYGEDGTLTTAAMVDTFFTPKRLVASPDGMIYVIGESGGVKRLAFRMEEPPTLVFGNFDSASVSSFGRSLKEFYTGGFVADDNSLVLPGVLTGDTAFPNTGGDPVALSGPYKAQGSSTSVSQRTNFVARYLPDGELSYAFLEYDGEFGNNPMSPITEYPHYDPAVALLNGDTIVVTGLLHGTVTFGNDEPNEVSLLETESPYFIAAYNLDGTLLVADYLDVSPGLAGLAATPDGALIVVSDGIDFDGGEEIAIERFVLKKLSLVV